MTVAVTGGAGYIGALVADELLEAGHRVRVLDSLLHGQEDVALALQRRGVDFVSGDVRDADARGKALAGARAVVHLAAIVGDPACARDPLLSHSVNVEGSKAVLAEARRCGAERLVFASTCSNYGRMDDPTVPVDETGVLRPISLYAEQKVGLERELLDGHGNGLAPICLRFATVYGVASRMRFDLTINEFTRDLWAGRELEVFGELFWRPYVHVRDAARAVRMSLQAPADHVARQVFNVGDSNENYRKLDLARLITSRLGRGKVSYVRRDEDPRDYKVSFERIRSRLGFVPLHRVPTGIGEIVRALESGRFDDPFDRRFSNI